MSTKQQAIPQIVVYTHADWHNWLKKHHLTEQKVAMINYKKHTGKPSLSHQEAMHEAICWGWIDTTIKRLDDSCYIRYFMKRNEHGKGNWSVNTLSYAARLEKEGRLQEYGKKMYEQGKQKPAFDAHIPQMPEMPEALKMALNKNKSAKHNFEMLAPSYKKTYLRWLLRAKQAETRAKRIALIVTNLAQNKKLFS